MKDITYQKREERCVSKSQKEGKTMEILRKQLQIDFSVVRVDKEDCWKEYSDVKIKSWGMNTESKNHAAASQTN